MKYRVFLFVMVSLCLFISPLIVAAEKQQAPRQMRSSVPPLPPPPPHAEAGRELKAPPLKMVEPGVFEIGGVRILKKEGRVEFPATVNMEKGLLEYLIVGNTGKVHESLLRTEVEPYCLQIALLMIGLEGSTNPLAQQGDPRRPEGDPVSIWVLWQKGEKTEKVRIEQWVFNKGDKNPMNPVYWIFTGSVISNGVFMAQVEKSIVAVFRDPVAIIDNPLPEGASDEIWFVNESEVPPVGTGLTVVIQKEAKKINR